MTFLATCDPFSVISYYTWATIEGWVVSTLGEYGFATKVACFARILVVLSRCNVRRVQGARWWGIDGQMVVIARAVL